MSTLPTAPSDDLALVRRCQQGNSDAFGQLMTQYQDRIFNMILRLVGHREEARDLTQETFLKAYQGLAKFKGESAFFTWLFRIGLNVTTSARRKYASRRKMYSIDASVDKQTPLAEQLPDESEDPLTALDQQETREFVSRAIRSLDQEFRVVIVLRDIEGLSYEEIREVLQCPIGTVRSRLHRARSLLKEKLKPLFLRQR